MANHSETISLVDGSFPPTVSAMARLFRVLQHLGESIERSFPRHVAHAHCDIPCGIYNSFPAVQAAQTVQKMVTQLLELKEPTAKDPRAMLEYLNAVTRRVQIKEEHTQLCKKELLVLWTDYFKPEHLKMFPDLHEKVWIATKLCSQNKQSVDPKAANDLLEAAHEIGHMWEKAEAAKAAAAR